MRSIKFAFAALALAAATTAFAATTNSTQTMSLTNNIQDSIATGGSLSVVFSALGGGTPEGSPTLTYSTNASRTGDRKITVHSEALPEGVTGSVAVSLGDGNGSTSGAKNLQITPVDFVTTIPAFITQNAAALTYSFTASKGFVSDAAFVVTYTLSDD